VHGPAQTNRVAGTAPHAGDVEQGNSAFADVFRQFEKTAARAHIDRSRGDASDENRDAPSPIASRLPAASPAAWDRGPEHPKHDTVPQRFSTWHDGIGNGLHAKRDAPPGVVAHLNQLFARGRARRGEHGDFARSRVLNMYVLHEPQHPVGARTDEPTRSPPI
jgi:hypothetical protein